MSDNSDKKSGSSRNSERYIIAILLLIVIAALLLCVIAYRSSSNFRHSSRMIYAGSEYIYATDENGRVPDIEYPTIDLLEKKDVVHVSENKPAAETNVLHDADGHISYQVTVEYPFKFDGAEYYAYKEYEIPEEVLPYRTAFQVTYNEEDIAIVFAAISLDENGRIEKSVQTYASVRTPDNLPVSSLQPVTERDYDIEIYTDDAPESMTFTTTVRYENYPTEKFEIEP